MKFLKMNFSKIKMSTLLTLIVNLTIKSTINNLIK